MLFREEKLSLLEIQGKLRLEGYVVFSPSDNWYAKWLGDYGHVSILIRQGYFFTWVESSIGFTHVKILPIGWKMSELFPKATEIHRFSCWKPEKMTRVPQIIAPFTCVEVAKSFFGLKNPLLLTPKQLLSVMKKRGFIKCH